MKNSLLIFGFALALASCGSDTYEDWSTPQHSDPEASKDVKLAIANADAINFGTLNSDSVQLFKPTVTETNTTASSYYNVAVNDADKANSVILTANDRGYVASTEFKQAVESLYGKRPADRNISLDVLGYAATPDGVTIKNTGSATIDVTVVAPFIDEAYYLVGDMFTTSTTGGWSKEGAHAFTHVGSGNVYDAPEFQIVFKTTADNQYWKIIPKTNYEGDFWAEGEKGVVGVVTDGDVAAQGNLTTNQPKAGKIEHAGYHRMTINMMDYSYKIEDLNYAEYIYEIGNESTWSESHPLWGGNFDGLYTGYYYLDGEFKFKPNADNWDGDWGQDPNGEAGRLVQEGESNVPGVTGFYQIKVDLGAMTYSLQQVNKVSIMGSFNTWTKDIDLTYNKEANAWVANNVTFDGDCELKFRMNHEWTVSWGGANGDGNNFDNLTEYGGADLKVEAGTYDIMLYISCEGKNHVVFHKHLVR